MSWKQVGKRELVGVVVIGGGFGDEVPRFQGGDSMDAFGTVLCYRLLCDGSGLQVHGDRCHASFQVGDDEFQPTGEKSTGRIGAAIEDAWGRFHLDLDPCRFCWGNPGTALVLGGCQTTCAWTFLLGTEVKEVHGGGMAVVIARVQVGQVVEVGWPVLAIPA